MMLFTCPNLECLKHVEVDDASLWTWVSACPHCHERYAVASDYSYHSGWTFWLVPVAERSEEKR